MIRLFICGITGAMGKNVISQSKLFSEFEIVGGFGHGKIESENFDVFTNFDAINFPIDCIIDFSTASIVDDLLNFAQTHKIPIVLCTTGLSEATLNHIDVAAQSIPIFKSGNMSLGINLLMNLVKQAASVLENGFDIEIIEKHHNRKLDAPSGTALMLAEAINDGLQNKKEIVLGREAHGSKVPSIINVHSIRGGNIVGEHEVLFAGSEELIAISHTALSRSVFANGALEAAKFLVRCEPGLYNMDDLVALKLKSILKSK
ncbi:4-hydroxy-tetrahydrodipicolinate reductase [Fusibacter bizertensis]